MAQPLIRIQVSVPPEEYAAAVGAAEATGEKLTTLIRRLLREAAASKMTK